MVGVLGQAGAAIGSSAAAVGTEVGDGVAPGTSASPRPAAVEAPGKGPGVQALPSGWKVLTHERQTGRGQYKQWVDPTGKRFRTLREAIERGFSPQAMCEIAPPSTQGPGIRKPTGTHVPTGRVSRRGELNVRSRS